jgi:hypothetical protein
MAVVQLAPFGSLVAALHIYPALARVEVLVVLVRINHTNR